MRTCKQRGGIPVYLLCVLLFGMALLPKDGEAGTWIVKPDGSGDAPTIQAAIDSARAGDEILVWNGTYYENLRTLGKSFTLRSMFGPEYTIVDGADGRTSVLFSDYGETSETLIEGFTFQNGIGVPLFAANHDAQLRFGGGIALLSSRPTIRDCIVKNNTANIGGAIFVLGDFPLFESVVIDSNVAGDGAAIAFEDCQGIRFWEVEVTNNFGVIGVGFAASFGSAGTFKRCRFENNAGTEGGLFRIIESQILLSECVAVGQQAGEGSLGFVEYGDLRIVQCTLVGNGGQLGDPVLISLDHSSLLLDRSILAFNEASMLLSCSDATAQVTCCDIFPPVPVFPPCVSGSQNIQQDPIFCDLEGNDLTLRLDSPCSEENSPPGCGLMGALPVGCGTSGIPSANRHVTTWGRLKVRSLRR